MPCCPTGEWGGRLALLFKFLSPPLRIFWFHPNNITIFSWVRCNRVWQPCLDIKRVLLSGEIDILFNLFKQVFTFNSWQLIALQICLLLQMRNISCNNIIILGSKLHHQIFTIQHPTSNSSNELSNLEIFLPSYRLHHLVQREQE